MKIQSCVGMKWRVDLEGTGKEDGCKENNENLDKLIL